MHHGLRLTALVTLGVLGVLGVATLLGVLVSRSVPPPSPSAGGDWKVGSCALPDPEAGPDEYRAVGCAVSGVTHRVIGVGDAAMFAEPDCPPSTDLLIDVTVPAKDGSGTLVPSGTACLRSLTGPHPGDPGNGGGQLGVGDCINPAGADITEQPCGSSGLRVLALVGSVRHCPPGTTEEIELIATPFEPASAICAQQFG